MKDITLYIYDRDCFLRNRKSLRILIISLLACLNPFSYSILAQINTDLDVKKKSDREIESKYVCKEFYTPFNENKRDRFQTLKSRIISRYGEFRSSYKRGHKHAGIDLKGDFNETVYSTGKGQVYKIFKSFPHKTIVVKHALSNGTNIYSVYTHVEDIKIKMGDWVDENIPIARLFNKDELKRADFGTLNHLHFEIRKSFEDDGRASWASMTLTALNMYCHDPVTFFRQKLK